MTGPTVASAWSVTAAEHIRCQQPATAGFRNVDRFRAWHMRQLQPVFTHDSFYFCTFLGAVAVSCAVTLEKQ